MTTGRINQVAVRTRGGSLSPWVRLGSRVQLVPGTDKVPYDIRLGLGSQRQPTKFPHPYLYFLAVAQRKNSQGCWSQPNCDQTAVSIEPKRIDVASPTVRPPDTYTSETLLYRSSLHNKGKQSNGAAMRPWRKTLYTKCPIYAKFSEYGVTDLQFMFPVLCIPSGTIVDRYTWN